MELTRNDIQNILILLNRVTLKAGEARDFVILCDKLNDILEQPEQIKGAEDNEQ